MPFSSSNPVTPTSLSPTNLNAYATQTPETKGTNTTNHAPTPTNGDEKMDIEPTHQLNQLHLSEAAENTPNARTSAEIIAALQAELQQLKTENKRLGYENRHWKDISEQRKSAMMKHGEKMHAMNQRLFKLSRVESQLKKLQKNVGEALESVEENEHEEVLGDLSEGEEVNVKKGKKRKGKGAKREAEGEDQETEGMGANKRARVDAEERKFGEGSRKGV